MSAQTVVLRIASNRYSPCLFVAPICQCPLVGEVDLLQTMYALVVWGS
jgi:hypothetical protein